MGSTLCFGSMRLNMGAFFSMSGMIINLCRKTQSSAEGPHSRQTSVVTDRTPEAPPRAHRIRLPRTKMCSRLDALPSCSHTRVSRPMCASAEVGVCAQPGVLVLR